VEHGTGKTEDALPVLKTGFSTIWVFVYLFLTNAELSTDLELVSHATRDTT
jgi:hypothetical protein